MATVPTIEIKFRQLSATLIERTGEQRVVFLLDEYTYDATENPTGTRAYYAEAARLSEVNTTDLAAAVPTAQYDGVYRCLQYCFGSAPRKVIISNLSWADTFERLVTGDDTYCVVTPIGTQNASAISTLMTDIKSRSENDGTPCMGIYTSSGVSNPSPRGTHIICIADNTVITYKSGLTDGNLSEQEKRALYAGAVASCGIERSLTNYTLPFVTTVEKGSAATTTVYETATAAGIITARLTANKPRVVTGINTAEVSGTVTEDMQHIEVICTMDMIVTDIVNTFVNYYRGAYKNNYTRQLLLISAINGYFRELADEEALDGEFNNHCEVDVERQRNAWIASGKTEAEDWSDDIVRTRSFKNKVYLLGNVKICQSMEDLYMYINLE